MLMQLKGIPRRPKGKGSPLVPGMSLANGAYLLERKRRRGSRSVQDTRSLDLARKDQCRATRGVLAIHPVAQPFGLDRSMCHALEAPHIPSPVVYRREELVEDRLRFRALERSV